MQPSTLCDAQSHCHHLPWGLVLVLVVGTVEEVRHELSEGCLVLGLEDVGVHGYAPTALSKSDFLEDISSLTEKFTLALSGLP